jgi:hypothetical protein
MIAHICCYNSTLAYWKLNLLFRLLLVSCQQNMPSNWMMTERNQTDRSIHLFGYRVLIKLQILTCSIVLSDWLISHPQNSICWSGHPPPESWRTVWQMHFVWNWPLWSKCRPSVVVVLYRQRQGAASTSWCWCLKVHCILDNRCTATDQQFRNTVGCKTVGFKWTGLSQHSYCLGHDQHSWLKIFHSHSGVCVFLLFIHCLVIFLNKYVPKSVQPFSFCSCGDGC